MTIEEALGLLELSGSEEPSAVKRAYLRAVKRHPPERDADGFRRVREAYELLSNIGQLSVFVPAPDSAGEAAVPEQAPPPHAPPFDAESDEAAIARLKARLDEQPHDQQAWWQLHELHAEAEREEEADAVLLAAHRAGCDGFLHSLLWSEAARQLSNHELEAAAREVEGYGLSALAQVWMARGRPVRAARVLRRQVELASEQGQSVDALLVCEVVLELVARDKPRAAEALATAFHHWLLEAGPGRLAGEAAGRWALVHELMVVRWHLPAELGAAIARALLAPDPTSDDEVLLFRTSHQHEAARAVKTLEHSAPELHKLYAQTLLPPEPARARLSSNSVFVVMAAIAAQIIFVRLVNGPFTDQPADKHAGRVAIGQPLPDEAQHFAELCERARAPLLAEQARKLSAELRRGDCTQAEETLERVEAGTAEAQLSWLNVGFDSVRKQYEHACDRSPREAKPDRAEEE